jgi:hypothetical protein
MDSSSRSPQRESHGHPHPGRADALLLHELDAAFRTVLGGDHIGLLFRVHGQEFHSFGRATGSKTLREFPLRLSRRPKKKRKNKNLKGN